MSTSIDLKELAMRESEQIEWSGAMEHWDHRPCRGATTDDIDLLVLRAPGEPLVNKETREVQNRQSATETDRYLPECQRAVGS